MKPKYKVGDKVRWKNTDPHKRGNILQLIGTIVAIEPYKCLDGEITSYLCYVIKWKPLGGAPQHYGSIEEMDTKLIYDEQYLTDKFIGGE